MSSLTAIDPISSVEQSVEASYRNFRVEPINGALGAVLRDIDLGKVTDEAAFDEIRDALIRHQVIVFRNQQLKPKSLIEIGRRFGDLHVNPFVQGLEEYPEIMPVRAEENHEKQFTGLWHSDISWDTKPSMGSLLYAVKVPQFGGDTLFSNMYLAYSTLSPGMQKLLNGLSAEHRVDRNHSSKPDYADAPKGGIFHPVVTTHPVTGKSVLFVNEYFTTRFENMSEEESLPLLSYLYQHSVRPDFTCRIHWEPGTLVFWDNRCTLHYATNDYPGLQREMHRVTINGEIPRR